MQAVTITPRQRRGYSGFGLDCMNQGCFISVQLIHKRYVGILQNSRSARFPSKGAIDQRWVTGVGPFDGNRADVKLELTSSGKFNASDPQPVQDTDYGTMIIEFDSCSAGTVSYDFPSVGESGAFNIVRALEDNVALCETLMEPDTSEQ